MQKYKEVRLVLWWKACRIHWSEVSTPNATLTNPSLMRRAAQGMRCPMTPSSKSSMPNSRHVDSEKIEQSASLLRKMLGENPNKWWKSGGPEECRYDSKDIRWQIGYVG